MRQSTSFRLGAGVQPLDTIVIHHTAVNETVQKDLVDKAHQRKYNWRSWYGSYILYHIMIGTDGTVIYNRGLNERTGHTMNNEINMRSVAIVLAGNFNDHEPDRRQLAALKKEIEKLQAGYGITNIIPHKDASATQCPGKHLEEWIRNEYGTLHSSVEKKWIITRYYTPVPNQKRYYIDTYEQDFKVNCMGDCLSTASTYRLTEKDAYKVAACPPTFDFGTKLDIEGIGVVTCRDRGGMIKEDENSIRIDVWAGIGDAGLQKILTTKPPQNPKVTIAN